MFRFSVQDNRLLRLCRQIRNNTVLCMRGYPVGDVVIVERVNVNLQRRMRMKLSAFDEPSLSTADTTQPGFQGARIQDLTFDTGRVMAVVSQFEG